jgi:hypothetical protein
VFIADDYPVILDELVSPLEKEPELSVAGLIIAPMKNSLSG